MNKERIEWVDIAKGIGIILVIIGHCVCLGHFTHNWIFSFHMQLFFILSGLFFAKNNLFNCFKRKFRQLIVPYIIFCVIGFAITIIVPQWRSFSVKDIAKDIYWGYPNTINVSSIWFLMCLFIVTLLFDVILMIQSKNSVIGWTILIIVIGLGFLLGRVSSLLDLFPTGRMPLNMDCACVALLFYALGYYLKNIIFGWGEKIINVRSVYLIIGLMICFSASVIVVKINGTVNLHGVTFNNEILYILGSLAGFAFVLLLSFIIQKVALIKNIFVWLGRNSLKIMGTQAIVLRLYLLILNGISDNKYELYFLPPFWAILGCFVVTCVSCAVVFTIDMAWKYVTEYAKNKLESNTI